MSASEPAMSAPTIRDILGDEELALLFREFLHQLQCAENLSFYVEVEDYKRLPTAGERTERAEKVWSKYFGQDCPTPLNVDAKCRQRLDGVLTSGNVDIFEEASEFAFSLLSLDCYRKFIGSEMYSKWLGASLRSPFWPCVALPLAIACHFRFLKHYHVLGTATYPNQTCTNRTWL